MFVIVSVFSAFRISLWIPSNSANLLIFSLLIYYSISCIIGGGQMFSLYSVSVHWNVFAGSSQLSKFSKDSVHFFSITCYDVISVQSSPANKFSRFLKPSLILLIFWYICLVLLSRWFLFNSTNISCVYLRFSFLNIFFAFFLSLNLKSYLAMRF